MATTSFQARISKVIINRLQPGDTVWDTELKGFGARRQKNSTSYFMKTRVDGRQKWFTIGKHGQPWNPDTARKKALAIKVDPSTEIRPAFKKVELFVDIIEEFKLDHLPKLKASTSEDYERLFRTHLIPALGKMKITEITRIDVSKLHTSFSHTPRRANTIIAVLSKIMSWSEGFDYRSINSNPCIGIKKYPEQKRQRYLTSEELGRLGNAITQTENDGLVTPYSAAAIRLLIFTGARLGEILGLRWNYIDFERRKIWLPDSKTGQKVIALNAAAIDVLNDIPRLESNPYVIVGKNPGSPLVNLQKPWRLIRGKADLDDVHLHDLRHSFASIAASSGASLPMIGKLLGHTQPQTTARYAHLSDDPLEKLNEDIGVALSKALLKQ